jgi:hypothetical protein
MRAMRLVTAAGSIVVLLLLIAPTMAQHTTGMTAPYTAGCSGANNGSNVTSNTITHSGNVGTEQTANQYVLGNGIRLSTGYASQNNTTATNPYEYGNNVSSQTIMRATNYASGWVKNTLELSQNIAIGPGTGTPACAWQPPTTGVNNAKLAFDFSVSWGTIQGIYCEATQDSNYADAWSYVSWGFTVWLQNQSGPVQRYAEYTNNDSIECNSLGGTTTSDYRYPASWGNCTSGTNAGVCADHGPMSQYYDGISYSNPETANYNVTTNPFNIAPHSGTYGFGATLWVITQTGGQTGLNGYASQHVQAYSEFDYVMDLTGAWCIGCG